MAHFFDTSYMFLRAHFFSVAFSRAQCSLACCDIGGGGGKGGRGNFLLFLHPFSCFVVPSFSPPPPVQCGSHVSLNPRIGTEGKKPPHMREREQSCRLALAEILSWERKSRKLLLPPPFPPPFSRIPTYAHFPNMRTTLYRKKGRFPPPPCAPQHRISFLPFSAIRSHSSKSCFFE